MNTYYIALRHLFKKNKYTYISFSILFSLVSITLGTCLFIIVDSFTSGFNNSIDKKLSQIDGHIRIINNFNNKDNNKIDSLVEKRNLNSTRFISNYVLLVKNDKVESTLFYSIKNNLFDNYFSLNDFVVTGKSQIENKNDIILGYKLAEQLDISLNDNVILFSIDDIKNENKFTANLYNVIGIIKTGFPEYDKTLSFINYDNAINNYNTESAYTGNILNYRNSFNIDKEIQYFKSSLNPFYYNIESWKDRHIELYNWLSVYSSPIYFVMLSILILSIFNIFISIRLIIDNKINNFAILKSLGFSKKDLIKIIINKGMLISLFSSILGSIIAIFFLNIQNKYKFIKLSSDVYFIDFLPAEISYMNIFYLLLFTTIFSFLVSIFAARKILFLSPSKLLFNE